MPSVSELIRQFPYAGLFILLVAGGVGFPFPEDTTLLLCGFLIADGVVRPVPAITVVYCGILTTDLLLYYFGKKYGRMIVTHKRFRRIISSERLALMEERFNRNGILVIVIGRHLVGLRAQILIAAGVMKMSFVRFLTADAMASLLTIALMTGVGYLGGNSFQIIKTDIHHIEHLVIFLLVTILAFYLLFRYVKSLRKN
jgi:membrane protein DedA with SNARE-associated domain